MNLELVLSILNVFKYDKVFYGALFLLMKQSNNKYLSAIFALMILKSSLWFVFQEQFQKLHECMFLMSLL